MRGTGFEPAQALSYESLNLARLTTPAPPHKITNSIPYKKFYKQGLMNHFEDGHIRRETPGLIPNPEVMLPALLVVVSHKMRTLQAVFHYFL